jgi:zinc/manganese transport system substrate-binding protein
MKLYKSCLLILCSALQVIGAEKIAVVTTMPDLASLVQSVGGDRVQAACLVRGDQDPHHLEVLPSYMMKLRRAELFFIIGMDLEPWAMPLRDGSRNNRLQTIDCSKSIQRLEIPTSNVNPSHGDIHIYGNPHYWLDPENGKEIAKTIGDALTQVSPQDKEMFTANLLLFQKQLDEKIKSWQALMAPHHGKRIIFYHNSWPYLVKRFDLVAANFIEPQPGVAPSAGHIQALIRQIREQKINLIVMEPFYDKKIPLMLSRETGVKIVILPSSVGGVKEANDYIGLFDYIFITLHQAL